MVDKMNVVSDTSFYIAFLSEGEINDPNLLIEILEEYTFHIGQEILKEISEKHKNQIEEINFIKYVKFHKKFNYRALLSMLGYKVLKKGEYESIALAYILHVNNMLHCLILDDNPARKWVKKNMPNLHEHIKYSLRFLVDSCCSDKKMTKEKIINILKKVERSIRKGNRPFNLTKKKMNIINELIEEVEKC